MSPSVLGAKVRTRWWRIAFAALLVGHLLALYWPRIEIEGAPVDADKAIHLVLFGAPVAAAFRALPTVRWVVLAFAVHAPVSELAQALCLPGRSGDARDAMFDIVGVVLGALVGLWLRRRAVASRAGRIA